MIREPSDLHAPPRAAALIASLRALGYDLPNAVADLVDNSVTAEAVTVRVEYNADVERGWVAILDDGRGMTEEQLHRAMHLGIEGPWVERHPSDLGRFGLGLKTASFSQARNLTVLSSTLGNGRACRVWDMDHVRRRDDWYLLDALDEEAAVIAGRLGFRGPGTMVLWRGLDRSGTGRDLTSRMAKVREHLGAVFGRHLQRGSLRLEVGGQSVRAWDPFLRGHLATQDMGTEYLVGEGGAVTVTPYVLPHPSRILDRDSREAAGPSGWTRHQGFYVYRGNRLLTLGGWLGLHGLRQSHLSQLARIAVDISTVADHAWQVDIRKAKVIPPAHMRERLGEIAALARRRSEQVFRHRGATPRRRGGGPGELTFVWQQYSRRGRTGFRVNRDHPIVVAALSEAPTGVLALLRLIEETLPVGLIAAEAANTPELVPQPPLDEAEREEVTQLLRTATRNLPADNASQQAFLTALRSTEPFNRFPEVLAEILGDGGAHGND